MQPGPGAQRHLSRGRVGPDQAGQAVEVDLNPGGVGDGVQVGDVVVAHDYVQHDMDASPLFPRWELPGYARTRLSCDTALTAMLLEAVSAYVQSAAGQFDSKLVAGQPRAHRGLIASGDRFVSAAQEVQNLRTALTSAGHEVLAVEMEGAAVAQVCLDYGVPFAALRTISDRADDMAHVDFTRFARRVASRYSVTVLARCLRVFS